MIVFYTGTGNSRYAAEALAHFTGGFVSEGDGENAGWRSAVSDEVGDAVGQSLGLARTSPSQNQKRAVYMHSGFSLFVI